MKGKVIVFPDLDYLTSAALEHFLSVGQAAILHRERFMVALSGGTTPRILFQRLTIPRVQDSLDWSRVHIFWADERCVPAHHAESNYRMARELLLKHVPLPQENIHRVLTELGAEGAARQYEEELAATFGVEAGGAKPVFDLVLLGMGSDGHTASLFPGTKVLEEQERWAAPVYVEKLSSWRITLTVPVLNAARVVLFMVTGTDKAQVIHEVLLGPEQDSKFPAQLVQPASGNLHWFLDKQAGAELPSETWG